MVAALLSGSSAHAPHLWPLRRLVVRVTECGVAINSGELHELIRARARLVTWTNRLWRRFAQGIRATDGFQIEVVRELGNDQVLLRATIFGGASFAGSEREVQHACREHVRRVARRGPRHGPSDAWPRA